MLPESERVTRLIAEWREGDDAARDQLFRMVHRQLRGIAARHLRSERQGHTLQPTALVNELYLHLCGASPGTWENRSHFFAVASHSIRCILIDHARKRNASKRGGLSPQLSLAVGQGKVEERTDWIAIDQALERLSTLAPRAAQVVEMRFFGGLEEKDIAQVLGVAVTTVKRDWRFARAWPSSHLDPAGSIRKTAG